MYSKTESVFFLRIKVNDENKSFIILIKLKEKGIIKKTVFFGSINYSKQREWKKKTIKSLKPFSIFGCLTWLLRNVLFSWVGVILKPEKINNKLNVT